MANKVVSVQLTYRQDPYDHGYVCEESALITPDEAISVRKYLGRLAVSSMDTNDEATGLKTLYDLLDKFIESTAIMDMAESVMVYPED